jgi:hypothetical protein
MTVTKRMNSLLESAGKSYHTYEVDAQEAFLRDVAATLSKKVSKSKVTFSAARATSTAFLRFDGVTKSDIEIEGSVAVVPVKDFEVLVVLHMQHAMLGSISDEARFKTGVLTTDKVADMVLVRLEQ